ncbi:response regulator, partial [bacterium]|nr:response regulator [bacterium]
MRQAQKMEAVGRLAGGVAHDFNNILTAIGGHSELLLRRNSDDGVAAHVREIKIASERAAALTRQLLAFSRKQVLAPRVFELNSVVAGMGSMLERLIGENVHLNVCTGRSLERVKADPSQIEQVLMNLALNARDAMPGGGQLTIQSTQVTLDESYARGHAGVVPGEYVMLAVSDTGTGMTDDVKALAFEPFFTTKPAGKGTGLGLATCYGIVKQSGGHISVYSEPGLGTTFKVYLPRSEESVTYVAKIEMPLKVSGGGETLLVVEDEPAVRGLTCLVLKDLGYQVIEAADGEEALRLLQAQPEKQIDLLLTDVVMPQVGGKELARQFRQLRPGAGVLFCSGYTEDAILNHGMLEEGTFFLEKPYTTVSLARKVREALSTATKDSAPQD